VSILAGWNEDGRRPPGAEAFSDVCRDTIEASFAFMVEFTGGRRGAQMQKVIPEYKKGAAFTPAGHIASV